MKTYLTIEQSAELIKIGVSEDKVSSYEIVNYAVKPVFTLIDMFSIIPREIITEYPRRLHNLEIILGDVLKQWHIRYVSKNGYEVAESELIDALYKITIKCAQ